MMLEIVLHECGDTKGREFLCDIFEKDLVVPENWVEENTEGLFDEVHRYGRSGTREERSGEEGSHSLWDDIEWNYGPDEERYTIHPLRLNNGSRKWRSDRKVARR